MITMLEITRDRPFLLRACRESSPSGIVIVGAPLMALGWRQLSGETMKTTAIMGLLAVMACASSGAGSNGVGSVGSGDQDANVRHVSMTTSAGDINLQADGRSTSPIAWTDVNAPITQTWQYLPLAYKKLGLMHRFVRYGCRTVKCEFAASCSRLPPNF